MPLKIIRQDITKIKCDAIVNPTNRHMYPDGGADAAIHAAAGPELFEYCKTLGDVNVGEAKITPAFNLPCKYVIHTVGPVWQGGLSGERVLLRSCYKEAMSLALANGCDSIAFPLIASGLYGYPKEKVLREAVDVISEFLERHELDVYIVIYDKADYSLRDDVFEGVKSYIDRFYVEEAHRSLYAMSCELPPASGRARRRTSHDRNKQVMLEPMDGSVSEPGICSVPPIESLDDMLEHMDRGFADTLFYYIDKKGLTDVEAYKRSNVGKKTFSKIKCNKDYRPSKLTAVSFAIGLHLDIEETKHLLSTAGMCLSRASKFDVIIEYFIVSGMYKTIFDVNEVLYQFDQSLLGV